MRYLLFAGDNFYPCGGWEDFRGGFSTLKQAELALNSIQARDWAHIVDVEDAKIVVRAILTTNTNYVGPVWKLVY